MSSSAKKPARNTEKTEKAIPSLFLLESLRRVSRCAVLPHCRARSPEVRCFLQRAHVFLPLLEARRVVAQHSGGRRLFLRDNCSLSAKMNLTDRCQQLHFCKICNRFVDQSWIKLLHMFFFFAQHIYIYSAFDSPMILFHGCNFCLIPTMSPYNPRISQS